MSNKKILYVEDNYLFGLTMKLLINSIGHECIVAASYDEGLKEFRESNPDLLIVDINLGEDRTGLDLVNELGDDLDIPLIYLTSEFSDEIFETAISTKPVTFLNKPVSKINLQRTIEHAIRQKREHEKDSAWEDLIPESYFVREGNKLKPIRLSETAFIEVQDKYCMVHTPGHTFIIRIQLKKLTDFLPDNFVQIHRSYVINTNFLESLNQTQRVVVVSGKELPVGRSYYDNLKARMQLL